jgi:thiamine pyrophosphate-dependent acetolactate synthase large subunit-like protein
MPGPDLVQLGPARRRYYRFSLREGRQYHLQEAIARAVELLSNAKFPVILNGGKSEQCHRYGAASDYSRR